MLTIPRSLLRQLRAVFRRCLDKNNSVPPPVVVCEGQAKGLCVRLHSAEVLVDFRQRGSFSVATVPLPWEALADCEGRDSSLVELDLRGEARVRVSWTQEGVPESREYPLSPPERVEPFPPLPVEWTPQPPTFLAAWREAVHCTAAEGVRYALQRLQLRGAAGQLIATDGKQLLVQSGWHFPWREDLLVPRLAALDPRLLGVDGPVSLSKSEDHVLLRIGPWTFCLRIDTAARFPAVDTVIPEVKKTHTRWQLDPQDSEVLAQALPPLPRQKEEDRPVTVDLNGQVCVRERNEEGRVMEIVLERSTAEGQAVRFCLQREYLRKALYLGLPEGFVVSADKPLLFQDAKRKYVVMPVSKEGILHSRPDMLRRRSTDFSAGAPPRRKRAVPIVTSTPERTDAAVDRSASLTTASVGASDHEPALALARVNHSEPSRKRDEPSMPIIPPTEPGAENRNGNSLSADRLSIDALVAEAEALRALLGEALGRATQFLVALKHEKRQSKALRAAVASLRELQLGP